MAKDEEKQVLSGTFTAEDLAKIFQTMNASQLEAMKMFASELATKITHPEPTSKEREQTLQALAQRSEQAQQNEATKAYKRAHCCPPAMPHLPHRRSGQSWGMFSGSSVIAWMYTTMTEKTILGSRDSGPVAFGVCQWCATEFKPGDPDYEQALSWGTSQSIGSYPMNSNTGVWQNA